MSTVEEREAEAKRLEQSAADKERRAEESFERCDTDGFLSQWASGICAQRDRLQADVVRNGGVMEFPALFDLGGNLVAAKLIKTRYGMAWGILASDDPQSKITGWVTAHPARPQTIERKGYREGTVRAKAKADIRGSGHGLSGTAWACVVRTDGGFSRDVEIVSNGTEAA